MLTIIYNIWNDKPLEYVSDENVDVEYCRLGVNQRRACGRLKTAFIVNSVKICLHSISMWPRKCSYFGDKEWMYLDQCFRGFVLFQFKWIDCSVCFGSENDLRPLVQTNSPDYYPVIVNRVNIHRVKDVHFRRKKEKTCHTINQINFGSSLEICASSQQPTQIFSFDSIIHKSAGIPNHMYWAIQKPQTTTPNTKKKSTT